MRDATIHYLQKSFDTVKSLASDGKKADIFGCGTEDIVFKKSGSFMDLVSSAKNSGILEYRNVTIPEGISIVGNTYTAGRFGGIAYPFYLKVNGTLTVNGVLNMNGSGQPGYNKGGMHSDEDAYYNEGYSRLGRHYALGVRDKAINANLWRQLHHLGEKYPFFDGQTYFVGAGNCRSYKWKKATKYRHRHAYCTTPLNSGGDFADEGGKKSSGAGGGFIALYYENLDYKGPNITFDGINYPAHINANGGNGAGLNDGAPVRWGGGMMVIAARNIIVGPNGYICSNPSRSETKSVGSSPVLGDSNLNNGGMALMNLPWEGHNFDYSGGNIYRGHDRLLSGGPGIVFGYKITPEFREQNR